MSMWELSDGETASDDDRLGEAKPVVAFNSSVEDVPEERMTRRPSLIAATVAANFPTTSPKNRKKSAYFGAEFAEEGNGRGHEAVRQNLKRRQTARYEQLAALVEKANKKLEVAQTRRMLLESSKEEKVVAAWFSLMTSYSFAYRLDHRREVHKAMLFFVKRLAPCVRLIALRKRRQKRLAEARSKIEPLPLQLEILMSDSLLAKFGGVHLRTVIPAAKHDLFLAGTCLMYQGEQGSECFAIVSGEVEVLVKDGRGPLKVVATQGPGTVVGTIAMLIAGERRMATVRCKTDVQAYVLHRKAFMSCSADDTLMAAAIAEVSRLHEKNIPAFFGDMTTGEALSRFAVFSGIELAVLDRLRGLMTPKVIRAGEVIVNAGSLPTKMYLLLQGQVELHRESRCAFTQSAIEVFANMADVATVAAKNGRKEYFLQNANANGKGNLVGVLEPKTMIGGPMFLIMEPYQLTVVAKTSVDAMIIDGTEFLSHMMSIPSSLGQMRKNACQAMATWIRPLPRHALHQSIFSDCGYIAFQALRAARQHDFEVRPVVISQGEVVEFGPNCSDAYIVVSGSLEGFPVQLPGLWPSIPVLFFGNFFTSCRVLHRIEAWKLSRKSFTTVLRAVLDDDRMSKFYVELYSQYEFRTGKTPIFEEIRGLHINNPLIGAAPPPPPPERSRGLLTKPKPAAAADSSSQATTKPAPEKASITDSKTSDAERPREHDDETSERTAQSRVESRASSVAEAQDDEAPTRRLPILPPSFRFNHKAPPMRMAIRDALRKQQQNCAGRSNSPPTVTSRPALPTIAQSARTTSATASDPYVMLFSDTDVANAMKFCEYGAGSAIHPTSHRKRPLITSPKRSNGIVSHDVDLSSLRRTKQQAKLLAGSSATASSPRM